MKKKTKNYTIPLVAGILFIAFLMVSFFDILHEAKIDTGMVIAKDVAQLRDIFHKIHRACTIINFDAQKNSINFLNVGQFEGSEVGPMNLVHPERWEGPYLKENPTIAHIAYQVVSTDKGYFVTPGDGVKLPNGKVVGKDIVLDKKADIAAIMRDPKGLMYKDRELAAALSLGVPANIQFFMKEAATAAQEID